jgi:FPC/CPF motif-containing protein YcgG
MSTVAHSQSRRSLADFIEDSVFPCMGARAALARESITTIEAGALDQANHDQAIVAALQRFTDALDDEPMFVSVAVMFEAACEMTEPAFEHALWQRLQAWHEIDRKHFDWDARVSSDPSSADFSMSIGGHAFYVIGLHPGASRPARRFWQPVLVLNLHSQFERLRADGRYDKLRAAITERDVALSGSSNPMLAVHGKSSEARQYSGRQVAENWVCPFHTRAGDSAA